MWRDLGIRFLFGGGIVSLFVLLGDVFKPKSFAGVFSAAVTSSTNPKTLSANATVCMLPLLS